LTKQNFLYLFEIKFYNFLIFVASKNGRTKKMYSPSFFGVVVGSGMDKNQDPGSGINIPDPQHWCYGSVMILWGIQILPARKLGPGSGSDLEQHQI
jgi:hypothetical protein